MVKDFYTKESIPKKYVVNVTQDKYYDNRNLIVNRYGETLHKFAKNTTVDCWDREYIKKDRAHRVLFKNDGSSDKYVIRYTLHNMTTYVQVTPDIPYKRSSATYTETEAIAKEFGYKESVYGGFYYDPKYVSASKLPTKPIKYKQFPKPIIGNSRKERIKFGEYSPTDMISEGKGYTIGYEIETSKGYVPMYVAKNLNMLCVYDGSIRDDNGNKHSGGEYVTGVLRGDAGFKHLYEILKQLSKRCEINKTCSFHVHVGNADFSKQTVVALWKLAQMLEAELYSMMPKSRKERAHCRPIKRISFTFDKKLSYDMNIDKLYRKLFHIVSLGKYPSKTVNKMHNHPAGDHCGFDTSTPRYWWINFVPTMFNLKGKGNWTAEFRMHSATLNFTKAKNWSLISQGIVYVAENYSKLVFSKNKFTLAEVMKLAYPKKHEYLSRYINERKNAFKSKSSLVEKLEYNVDQVDKAVKYSDAIWD